MTNPIKITPTTQQAHELFHEGNLALAEASFNGINIDRDYCRMMLANSDRNMKLLKRQLSETDLGTAWGRRYGSGVNYLSNTQLPHVLFGDMGYKSVAKTSGGKNEDEGKKQASVSEESLLATGCPDIGLLLSLRGVNKMQGYLKGMLVESTPDGFMHPFFSLATGDFEDDKGGARSFRSCIAKGMKVLAVRDFIKYPDGVPIEEIKIGDLVYCFDNELNPKIRKVLWAGKTGHQEIIRLHFQAGPRKGYIDLTPDHLVRHISGVYIKAKDCYRNHRNLTPLVSNKSYKCHLLSAKRCGDEIFFAGHINENGGGFKEHRFIYEQIIGKLEDWELVHHKNENHFDHDHGITKIEWLKQKVDVYDIEVEEFNNFVANEICVHNSSSAISFQTFPKHDGENAKLVRRGIIPRPGHRIVGRDYGTLEVGISACLHQDKNMIGYLLRGEDMHKDCAAELFILQPDQCTKKAGEYGGQIRQVGKNSFVFPQMYNQNPENTARNLWNDMNTIPLRMPNDPGKLVSQHLADRGIRSYESFESHVKKKVDWFWNSQFPDYGRWRVKWIAEYQKRGYIEFLTGFRIEGVLSLYQIGNYPIQGPAAHCLLLSLILTNRLWKSSPRRSLIIGEIHDELTTDEHDEEIQDNQNVVPKLMTEGVRKEFKWVIIPLVVETTATGIGGAGGNWWQKASDLKFPDVTG